MKTDQTVHLGGIGIEYVRGCNFACRMCPSTVVSPGIMRFMPIETVQLAVERLNEATSINALWAFGLGEPLSHPEIYRVIQTLNTIKRSENCPVIMHTNASLLQGEAAYALLEIPFVTQLMISFDGYGSEESYTFLRGDHFQEVIDNVRNFTLMVRRYRPSIFISTCSIYPEPKYMPPEMETKTYDEAMQLLQSIFLPMGVQVSMRKLHNYNGFVTPELFQNTEREKGRVLGGCGYLEENSFEIALDGTIRPCRDTINEEFVIGDLRKQRFAEIVRSEPYLSLRHNLRLDRRELYEPCKNCDKHTFGEDIDACANYWEPLLQNNEVTDPEERRYLSAIIGRGQL